MPGMDGTGPKGLGSMTGRGLGNCSDDTGKTRASSSRRGRGSSRSVRRFGRSKVDSNVNAKSEESKNNE